jgi:hypothetical protein
MIQIDVSTITTILLRNFCPLENGIGIKTNEIQSDFPAVKQADIVVQMLHDGYLRKTDDLIYLGRKGEELIVDACA